MKKLFTLLIVLTASLSAMAYDFEKDGIYYNITGNSTVDYTAKQPDNHKKLCLQQMHKSEIGRRSGQCNAEYTRDSPQSAMQISQIVPPCVRWICLPR